MSLTQVVEARLEAWIRRTGGRGPFAIGIGGGSASGKSTIARQLAADLAPLQVEVLGQDRFFRPAAELPPYPSPARPQPWPDYNRPDSFRVDELLAACAQPRSAAVLIVEGILVLYYDELRRLLDLALYVDADADERIVRRIRRNLPRIPLDEIADYYLESVRYQHARYNAPTRAHADLVIPGGAADTPAREALLQEMSQVLRARLSPGPAAPARKAQP